MFTVIQTNAVPAPVKATNGLTYLDRAGDLVMLVEHGNGASGSIPLRKLMLTCSGSRDAPFSMTTEYAEGEDISVQVSALVDLEIVQKNFRKVD